MGGLKAQSLNRSTTVIIKYFFMSENKKNKFEADDLIIYAMFILITCYSLSILIATIYGI